MVFWVIKWKHLEVLSILCFSALEDQSSFRVKYDFTGPHFQKYHDLYRLHNETFKLPKTWSAEPGTIDVGHDHSRGEWIFHGLSYI
jgi:hypothetical protein